MVPEPERAVSASAVKLAAKVAPEVLELAAARE